MQLPNREERTEPEKQGWLVWDSANGPYRTGKPKLSKKFRRKVMKAIRNIPRPEIINA